MEGPARMRNWILSGLVYTALVLGANAGDLRAYATGGMVKLIVLEAPVALPEAVLLDAGEAAHPLSDYRGKWVVLNFWATWCAPCLKEMPSLDALQAALGTENFAVVPVATGRNPVEAIARFYEKAGIANLPVLRDPKQEFARAMGVLGLPLTVILDRQGREVARLIGDADWNGPEARAILAALIAE